MYDSTRDTKQHINVVRHYLDMVIKNLIERSYRHDMSKLEDPEKQIFDEYTPKLRRMKYGSAEYKQTLKDMGSSLEHHYQVNDHHPEHFPDGIRDMDLMQVIEMLCDWKAATIRSIDSDLRKSIDQNAKRFGYGGEMKTLLLNTAETFGWID